MLSVRSVDLSKGSEVPKLPRDRLTHDMSHDCSAVYLIVEAATYEYESSYQNE